MERTYENIEEGLLTLFTIRSTTIDNEEGSTYDLLLCLDSMSDNKKKVKK